MSASQKAAPGRARDKLRLRLWLRLLHAERHVEAALRQRLAASFHTTMPRFDVLAALDRAAAGLTMSELSRRLLVSNGNVTGIVERLVGDGMVLRARVEGDRRANLVRLTAKGRERFTAMAREHEAWVDEMFARLPEPQVRALLGALETILRTKGGASDADA